MNHHIPEDVKIKRMKDNAKQKAMHTPEVDFSEAELDYLRITYPDLFDRVMFAHKDI